MVEYKDEFAEAGISTNKKNYIQLLFTLSMLMMIVMSSLVNTFEKYMPDFFLRSFRYGKFAFNSSKASFISHSEVPKAWFRHFYVFSSVLSIICLHFVVNAYIFGIYPPSWLKWFLDQNFGIYRYANVSAAHVLLAMILFTLQCLRRFYDTHFVSVFSKTGKMNFTHYIVGIVHYYGAILTIIAEAPLFAITQRGEEVLRRDDITNVDIVATAIFLWAWYHQHKSTVILANLRKNNKGEVVSQEHKVPHGGLFEYVSAPHIFTEKLMYTCLAVILWGNITWIFVWTWVLCNQVECALLNHWWYQSKFREKYPKNRKAVIPFIY